MALYKHFYSKENIFSAWHHVRAKAITSSNNKIRTDALKFEERISSNVSSISARLVRKSYRFPKATGVLKDQKQREALGKSPRPIVVPTIESRVVQRALLQVLQPSPGRSVSTKLGKINDVNACPYSYGCVPNGSVERAIKDARKFISAGNVIYFKTDIRGFFDHIRHAAVVEFIRQETGDEDIANIFNEALSIELENKNELNKYFELFPQDGIGVPQGSSLSAFCGNILLYNFDLLINQADDLHMLRYVDDLLILSKKNETVQKGKKFISNELAQFGLETYDPVISPDKAGEGHVRSGFDYLGCNVREGQTAPSRDSVGKLIKKVQDEIRVSKRQISQFLDTKQTKARSSEVAFIGTLSKIDRIVHGWGHSFNFVNDRLPFNRMDKEIEKEVEKFRVWFFKMTRSSDWERRQRAYGISLLGDVPIRESSEL